MSKKVVVIGGGPGGYTCAIRLAQLGATVVLVEKDSHGGTCLNRGCIPTKALVKSAEVFHNISQSQEFGINVENFGLNFGQVIARKNEIVKKLKDGILALIKSNKIEYIKGTASFIDKNTVEVISDTAQHISDTYANSASTNNTATATASTNNTTTTVATTTTTITADTIVIATGSVPSTPPIEGLKNSGVHTSDSILDLETLPKSLTIIGGGVIGMEFASIFQTFGTKVTVIEALPNILGNIDSDIAKRMIPIFKKHGTDIYTDSCVKSVELSPDNGLTVRGEGKKGEFEVTGELLLVATGRKPFVDGLNLDSAGVKLYSQSDSERDSSTNGVSHVFSAVQPHRNSIPVDCNGRTNVPNIYAIGDVNGGMMLAHVAAHQGIVAAHHIMQAHSGSHGTSDSLNASTKLEDTVIPSCVFTFPEIATAGKTEAWLKEQNVSYKVSKFMFGANGKALCLGEGEGFVKVLASTEGKDEGKILGVHIMGPHASDLIHEAVVAIKRGIKVSELNHIIHAHPTLSESLSEAFMGIEGLAIHMVNR